MTARDHAHEHRPGANDGADRFDAASLHRLQVRATRDERDVVPGFREKRPVVPADPAGSEHGDPHLQILLRVGMVGEARLIRRSNAEQW